MKEGKKLVYTGDLLRKFLHRKGITYKEAAKELGLDKNTIGKAVRGGNMNINVLLTIANHWNLPITDFFTLISNDECREAYFISPNPYVFEEKSSDSISNESFNTYKNIKKMQNSPNSVCDSKLQEIELLQSLIDNYQKRIEMLQQELEQTQSQSH